MTDQLKSFIPFLFHLEICDKGLYISNVLEIAVFSVNAETDCMEWREVSLILSSLLNINVVYKF